jgi:hypothetical protein
LVGFDVPLLVGLGGERLSIRHKVSKFGDWGFGRLHYECGTGCSRLRYDDELGILLGGDVDSAIACWDADLCEARRDQRKKGERREQHVVFDV